MMRKKTLEELHRLDPDEAYNRSRIPCVIVLDNIRSGLNVGSVFRTADAFAVEEIILCGISAQPPHREILKTAIGATESVRWSYVEESEEAMKKLKAQGHRLVGLEQTTNSIYLQHANIDTAQDYALIFGNEVQGLTEEILPMLDEAWEIPQFGAKHSLNIAVSVGIALWHMIQPHIRSDSAFD